jgi:uncharacterized SAM-binding protein YcdF (DUF218 family)
MMLLKGMIGVMTTPLVVAGLLAAAAWVCRMARRPRMSCILITCSVLLAYLSSISLVGQALLRPLESRYPPLAGDWPPPVGYVVVLGSSYQPRDAIPATAALDDDGLVRLVEAVRLARAVQGSRLVVSGGGAPGHVPAAHGYARLAQALGIPAQAIIVSDQPRDTREEARAVGKLLGAAPFLLVTSAYHMPRAMAMMKQAGTNPIAAPTGQRAYAAAALSWRAFLPESGGLRDTERAIHEYLGLAASAIGLD